ncbi:hypothetical protein ABVK25_010653 [Lepraria finkii]|uniref:Uncharacterized protein n=1 Tax=Lepraria finkii TaxID=1340010 RepID=A0ABR4ATM4_9LECA
MPSAAVVPGANSGIGYRFAEILVKEGYEVHALDITIGEKMKNLCCKTYQCDLISKSSIHSFAKNFKNKQLDLLFNIAGIMAPHESDSLTTTASSTF